MKKKKNEKWPYIPDHPYRIFITGGSGSGKTNITYLINEQKDIVCKRFSESKYEHLINNHEDVGIKHLNNSKAFIKCSNTMDDVYENIDNYNPKRKKKNINCF